MRTPCPHRRLSTAAELARRIAGDTLGFDPGGVAVGAALRTAAGTVTAFAAGWAGWSYAVGAAAAGGSIGPGIATLAAGGRPRIGVVASTAVAMAVATFAGSATAPVEGAHVAVATAWAVAAGMVAAVASDLTPVGLNSLVALLVFGRFPAPPIEALGTAAAVGAGGLLQTLLAAVVRRPHRARREVQALAAAYRALAAYATSAPPGAGWLEASAAVDAAATTLGRSSASGSAREAWDSLVDESDRVRLELATIVGARERMMRARPDHPLVPRIDRRMGEAGRILTAVGASLAAGRPTADVLDLAAGAPGPIPLLVASRSDGADVDVGNAAAALEALAGQLRAVTGQLPAALGSAPSRTRDALSGTAGDTVATLRTLWRRLRANATWQGTAVRHALRLAAAVVIAQLLGMVTGLARPYWIALTAAIVLRPDFATTFTRGVGRAVGTLVGVGLATIVALLLPPRHVVVVVLVGAFAWLAAALFRASFALFSAALTGVVVFLLAGVDPSPITDAVDRLVATALGAGLALGLYAAWPSWALPEARTALAGLCDAQRAYLAEVLGQVAGDRPRRREALDVLDRERRLMRGTAEAAVARSLADPPPRRIDAQLARSLLAALRRQVIAGHTLRTRVLDTDTAEVPEVLPVAAAVDATLAAAGTRLRDLPADPPPRLRPVHDELVARLRRRAIEQAVHVVVVIGTDEIVDAADTIIHRLWPPAE
jgi:uncharacterized membrane protein YccC